MSLVVEGTLRRDAFRDGAYADVHVMARIRAPEGGPADAARGRVGPGGRPRPAVPRGASSAVAAAATRVHALGREGTRRRTAMARKTLDCRDLPNEVGCTLTMSGEEDELMRAAVAHAIDVHDEDDTPAFRAALRKMMKNEVATPASRPRPRA